MIPIYSLFSFLWFRMAKLNYSEHLVLNSYKTAGELIISLLFTIITIFYTNISNLLLVYYILVFFGGTIYSVWFYSQLFSGYGYSRKAAIVRAIMIPVSYLLLSVVIGFIIGVVKKI